MLIHPIKPIVYSTLYFRAYSMKQCLVSTFIFLFLSLPIATHANDLAKPPIYQPSAEELDRREKQKFRDSVAQKQAETTGIAESDTNTADYVFSDGHDPRDHDHDHDDAADLDHEHDDPRAHQKQLEEMAKKGVKEESSWWPF